VYVSKTADFNDLTPVERDSVERHLKFARGLRIETRILEGTDVAEAIVAFARLNGVTQIFVAREKSREMAKALRAWFASAFVQRIVNLARDMQVTVVADRSVRRPSMTP